MMEFASSLAGAFFGALAAFLLEALRRRYEKRERDYEAVLRTQSVLLSQPNSLMSIRTQMQASDGTDLFDHLKHAIFGLTQQAIDFRDLAFLGKGSDPQLLLELDVAQEGYRYVTRLIELRNKMIDNFFDHPRTEIEEFDPSSGRVRAVGDLRLTNMLKQANEATAKAFLNAEETNRKTTNQLYGFASTEFPKRRLLRITDESAAAHASG